MAAATFSQTMFAPGGGAAASARATTYVRGTSTPLPVYLDPGLTTPATNPVIANLQGVLLFYLDGDLDYSINIKTSDQATTLLQVDYVANGGFFSIISYTIENIQFAEFLFTGDGAETEYTLPGVLAPSVHSLWVTIDGIYQPVGTYSLVRDATDSHVTFATAPANDAEISIRLMALQGQAGASAYQIAVNNGFVGTEPEWLETLIGTSSRDEQVFSGDGSDTTFVFTGMVITDKLNIMIFVDGIVQREADFSLSNNGTDTTITFTSAPPLGTDNIVMRGAVLTGSGGAAVDSVNGQTGVVVLDADDIGVTGTTNKFATAAELSKLAGIATGATVYTDEMARDALGSALVAGTGITITVNDAGDTITIAASGGGGGSGDVVGPASVTDSNLAAFDTTTGKLLKQVTNANAFTQIKQAASETATGVVELATDAETETGTDTTRAVTPANVTASYIKKSLVTTRGDIITRGASAPQRLALGASGRVLKSDGTDAVWAGQSEIIIVAVGDETTAITTGTAKVTFRMPFAMTLSAVRASLTTVSSSGTPTIDINEGGTTILSTKLTIDAGEKTSTTAAVAAVISDTALADDAEITIDIDVAGTGAAGLKVALIGTRT